MLESSVKRVRDRLVEAVFEEGGDHEVGVDTLGVTPRLERLVASLVRRYEKRTERFIRDRIETRANVTAYAGLVTQVFVLEALREALDELDE